MARPPEIGNVAIHPDRPLRATEKNGYVLKFYCPIKQTRVRRNTGTRDRREARRVQRECRERLLNGAYIESGGAISVEAETNFVRLQIQTALESPSVANAKTWEECFDAYYEYRKPRSRPKSLDDAASRIEIAGRILDAHRASRGLTPNAAIQEYVSLVSFELLQEQLLAGEEGLYDQRAEMSVNTMMGAVMAFFRYCERHGWIEAVPRLARLTVDEVMKGRPISSEEFGRMLEAVSAVVGEQNAESWRFVLRILWESAFRVADVMNFSWNDPRRIHPVWPGSNESFPTLKIPSSQKNKKAQEIPLLPGLQTLLETIPVERRQGWVVNPRAVDGRKRKSTDWFKPVSEDLQKLTRDYSNSAIAKACGVSETAVRKWLKAVNLHNTREPRDQLRNVPDAVISDVRSRADELFRRPSEPSARRLTTEYVGRVISEIGEKANIVVREPDEESGRRIKYASSHDLRRSCALRLINAGISAETLKIILRHEDFKTTEKFYGAVREAQSAAAEVHQKLPVGCKKDALVGGLMGGTDRSPTLTTAEVEKLKALLQQL